MSFLILKQIMRDSAQYLSLNTAKKRNKAISRGAASKNKSRSLRKGGKKKEGMALLEWALLDEVCHWCPPHQGWEGRLKVFYGQAMFTEVQVRTLSSMSAFVLPCFPPGR